MDIDVWVSVTTGMRGGKGLWQSQTCFAALDTVSEYGPSSVCPSLNLDDMHPTLSSPPHNCCAPCSAGNHLAVRRVLFRAGAARADVP